MIKKDSYFNKLPLDLGNKDIYLLEWIKYSFINIQVSYDRLLEKLTSISKWEKWHESIIFLDLWSFIDNSTRLYKLIREYSDNTELKKMWLFKLRQELKQVTWFRNTYQHLDERLEEDLYKDKNLPLYWIIKWVSYITHEEFETHIMFAWPAKTQKEIGVINPAWKDIEFHGIIWNLIFETPIKETRGSNIELGDLDIINLYSIISEIYNTLEKFLQIKFTEDILKVWTFWQDLLISLKIKAWKQ